MTRALVFDSPFMLGFDDMRALIERVGRGHDNYPPYNVEALSAADIRISIAVAGFTANQLTVELKGAHLVVSANKERVDEAERDYLHRGIGLRSFNRAFVLGDGWQVKEATLAYGLLNIDLVRPEPSDTARSIPIRIID